jgi:uncharacterized membrane protein
MFSRMKLSRWLLSLALVVPMVFTMVAGQLTFADTTQTPTPPSESLTLTCDYPSLKDASNNAFSYTVNVNYTGTQAKVFDLATQVPPGASAQTLNSSSVQITSLRIDPTQFGGAAVTVQFNPNGSAGSIPGQYAMTFSVKSGTLTASIQLNAMVTPKYGMHMTPQSGVFTATINAGQSNDIAIRLLNQGTVPLNNITLTATGPKGWEVSFVPDLIDSPIPASFEDKIDLIVKPPSNAAAGDYDVKINASSADATDSNSIRVTVQTANIWGWVWIIGAVVVIAGLVVLFLRMGRRKAA